MKRIVLSGEKMEARFSRVLQGRAQNPYFMSQGMIDRLQRMTKRVVGRQIDPKVLEELAKFKVEFTIFPGTSSWQTNTVNSIVLSSPNVKILSFVKKMDHSSLGPAGIMMSDILSLGIEDLGIELADDWTDVMISARIDYKIGDNTTPESILIRFTGYNTLVRIYYDGVLAYESQQDSTVGRYATYFEKAVLLATV